MKSKHQKILEYIKSLPIGSKISVRQVAKELKVSEGTAYRAIKESENFKNIHISIDLDVLPASVAPGVSAPAALGVEALKIHAMVLALAQTGKLRLVDVVELNPKYDVDARTAKLAARMIHDIIAEHGAAHK